MMNFLRQEKIKIYGKPNIKINYDLMVQNFNAFPSSYISEISKLGPQIPNPIKTDEKGPFQLIN